MQDLKRDKKIDVELNFSDETNFTLAEYHKKIEAGLADIKYNRIISKEDLEKEMQQWDTD